MPIIDKYFLFCNTLETPAIIAKKGQAMKTKIAIMSLALVSMGFCLDEYMPIAPKTLELDGGYAPSFGTGGWAGSTSYSATGSPMTNNIPLQVKYAIMAGLDAELGWTFSSANNDAGGASGFMQPDLAVKYAIPNSNYGVFLDVALPFATGDYNVSGIPTGISIGGVTGQTFGKIQAVGKASYQYNLKAGGVKSQDVLDVYLKPGYSVSDALGAYLGLDYNMKTDGDATTSPYVFSILPGVTYTQSKMLAYEVNVPFNVLGQDATSSWGVWASVYVTLGM